MMRNLNNSPFENINSKYLFPFRYDSGCLSRLDSGKIEILSEVESEDFLPFIHNLTGNTENHSLVEPPIIYNLYNDAKEHEYIVFEKKNKKLFGMLKGIKIYFFKEEIAILSIEINDESQTKSRDEFLEFQNLFSRLRNEENPFYIQKQCIQKNGPDILKINLPGVAVNQTFERKKEKIYQGKGLSINYIVTHQILEISRTSNAFFPDGDDDLYTGSMECFKPYRNDIDSAIKQLCQDFSHRLEQYNNCYVWIEELLKDFIKDEESLKKHGYHFNRNNKKRINHFNKANLLSFHILLMNEPEDSSSNYNSFIESLCFHQRKENSVRHQNPLPDSISHFHYCSEVDLYGSRNAVAHIGLNTGIPFFESKGSTYFNIYNKKYFIVFMITYYQQVLLQDLLVRSSQEIRNFDRGNRKNILELKTLLLEVLSHYNYTQISNHAIRSTLYTSYRELLQIPELLDEIQLIISNLDDNLERYREKRSKNFNRMVAFFGGVFTLLQFLDFLDFDIKSIFVNIFHL